MGSGEEPKFVATTVKNYDLAQLRSLYKGQLMGVGMMAFMHLYLKYTNPLLIQSVIPLKSAFEGNLIKIHLLGQPATGDLQRCRGCDEGVATLGGGECHGPTPHSIHGASREEQGRVRGWMASHPGF